MAVKGNFPHCVVDAATSDIGPGMLDQILKRRDVRSVLLRYRIPAAGTLRTRGACPTLEAFLAFCSSAATHPAVIAAGTQVVTVVDADLSIDPAPITELMETPPMIVAAGTFGYVAHPFYFWARLGIEAFQWADNELPVDFIWGPPRSSDSTRVLTYTGAKPVPASFQLVDGFSLHIDPKHVIRQEGPPIPPFGPERWRGSDPPPCTHVSPDAWGRWEADQRRFPAAA